MGIIKKCAICVREFDAGIDWFSNRIKYCGEGCRTVAQKRRCWAYQERKELERHKQEVSGDE